MQRVTMRLNEDHLAGMDRLYASLLEYPDWCDRADIINQFCEAVMAASDDERPGGGRFALAQLACNMLTQVLGRVDDGGPVVNTYHAVCLGLSLDAGCELRFLIFPQRRVK